MEADMARNADTQNNSSNCRDSYENSNGQNVGGQNTSGQNGTKNKASNKSTNKTSNATGQDNAGTDSYQR